MLKFERPEIFGTIVMADMTLNFECAEGLAIYTTTLDGDDTRTTECSMDHFLKALAIAIHLDGMPDFTKDYPDAEKAQPADPAHRWIP